MPSTAIRDYKEGVGGRVKAYYSVAADGGAVGKIDLPVVLPVGAIVTKVLVRVTQAFTSGGSATVALTLNSTGDLLGATAIASLTGTLDGIPDYAAANTVRATAERTLGVTIAVAALTAGAMTIYVDYLDP